MPEPAINVLQQFSLGGPVMVPLLLLSIAVAAVGVDRIRFWRRLGSPDDRRWRHVEQELLDGKRPSAGAGATPLGQLMRHLSAAEGPAARQLELQLILQFQTEAMARGERILEASAALGPLLGLLGTVTGLIRTFASMGIQTGSASMDRVALGISEVLVSTAMGILLALFAMVVLKVNTAFRSSYLALLERVALAYERNHESLACRG